MLSWISDDDLLSICKDLITDMHIKTSNELDFKNIVDPFSALFDIVINDISFDHWIKNEVIRQKQKTLQNKIGEFHQKILGKVAGWEDLGTGNNIDLVSKEKSIIAEIKNKHNTVKGSNLIDEFNKLAYAINYGYRGYTAYFVTILRKEKMNKPFVPSDSKTKTKPTENPNIRIIDGASFYEIATGSRTALSDLYNHLPNILSDFANIKAEDVITNNWFKRLAVNLPWG